MISYLFELHRQKNHKLDSTKASGIGLRKKFKCCGGSCNSYMIMKKCSETGVRHCCETRRLLTVLVYDSDVK
ncbi:hypothetical protein Mgra_00004943 [Meloidogyne graminicola]|uniref:Uncharacterized protein n=1 Tax=Meloidogyne graminicola TaxID=189291 RepID=A0A8S9ZQL4_9BILA|nr:hypothetical protein Mgra_00004943 [Meloidogyne graminicola]